MRQTEQFNETFAEAQSPGGREDTVASHRRAVERVITSARERLCEPISLHDMSRVAYLSAFHFNRVFHQITGLPPAKFISALRLDEAKRLLLHTNLSITDVCFEVGYNSLSTFTRLFNQRVGLGPREFRYLAARITPGSVESLCTHYAELTQRAKRHAPFAGIEGFVDSPKPAAGPIFVGLFHAHIPQSRPVGGALLTSPGPFHIARVPDGTYHLLAAALPPLADTLGYLLPDSANLLVGAGNGRVIVREGSASGWYNISLRPMTLTDPPLLISLPFLLADTLK
jgi:AraC family transcriptional regulator